MSVSKAITNIQSIITDISIVKTKSTNGTVWFLLGSEEKSYLPIKLFKS